MQTIKEIKEILATVMALDDQRLFEFAQDSRSGVQAALKQRQRQLLAAQAEEERLEEMLVFERELYGQGLKFIAGIDEVGRGPLAGPVVAAAVILPVNCKILGLNDSKQIPKMKHEQIFREICAQAVAIGIGQVDNHKIDEVNIYEATKIAMLQALSNLTEAPEHVLIDAMRLDMATPQTKIIHGDARSASIAAASIVAKVTRDQLMKEYAQEFPEYDFEHNAGYGTAKHLTALRDYGVTPIHRLSFEPIKSQLNF